MIINTILTTSVFTHLAGTYIIRLIRNRRPPRKHVFNFIDEERETNPNPKFLGSFPSLFSSHNGSTPAVRNSDIRENERREGERERERALFIFGLAPSSRGVLLVGVGRRRSFAKRARRGQARQAAGDVYEAQAGAAQRTGCRRFPANPTTTS